MTVSTALTAATQLPQFSNQDRADGFLQLHHLIAADDRKIVSLDKGDLTGSSAAVHAVLSALHSLQGAGLEDPEAVALLANMVKDYLEAYLEYLPGGREGQLSDVTLLVPLRQLSEKRLRLLPPALQACAEAILPLKYAADVSSVYHAYEAGLYVNTLKNAPLFLMLSASSFKVNTPATSTVRAFDLLGKELVVDSLDITQVRAIGREQVFWQGLALPSPTMELPADLAAGRYLINLKASIKDKSAPAVFQGYVAITDAVSVKHVSAGVSKETATDLQAVSQGEFAAQAIAEDGDLLHVAYAVEGRKPQQAFVSLQALQEDGVSAYFLSTRSEDGYTNSINLLEEAARFQHVSGRYQVTVLVGDAVTNAVRFVLGEIDIKFPAPHTPTHSLYAKSLLHTSDTTLKALPEIAHVMRPDARRAPAIVATAFAAATWAPLVMFVVFMLSLKPDLSRLSALSSVLWVLVLAAILVLYAGYWLGWQGFHFYATIKYICLLFPVLMVVGRYALPAVMEARHAQHEAASKKA